MRRLLSIKALVVLGLAIYVLYEIGGDLLRPVTHTIDRLNQYYVPLNTKPRLSESEKESLDQALAAQGINAKTLRENENWPTITDLARRSIPNNLVKKLKAMSITNVSEAGKRYPQFFSEFFMTIHNVAHQKTLYVPLISSSEIDGYTVAAVSDKSGRPKLIFDFAPLMEWSDWNGFKIILDGKELQIDNAGQAKRNGVYLVDDQYNAMKFDIVPLGGYRIKRFVIDITAGAQGKAFSKRRLLHKLQTPTGVQASAAPPPAH